MHHYAIKANRKVLSAACQKVKGEFDQIKIKFLAIEILAVAIRRLIHCVYTCVEVMLYYLLKC